MSAPAVTRECLGDVFTGTAARHPDAEALRVDGRSWTYAELDRLSRRWARSLAGAGRVGVLAGRTLEAYAGWLAGLAAGATVIPLSTENPVDRTRDVLRAAGVDVLLVDESGAGLLDEIGRDALPDRIVAPRAGSWASLPGLSLTVPDPVAEPLPARRPASDALAYVIFTSGSTGRPKGVPIRHRHVLGFLDAVAERYDLGPDDVVSQVYELTFDLSVFEVFAAWASGAALTVLNRLQALDPGRCVRRHGITCWTSTPSLVAAVRARGRLVPGSMAGVRYGVFCGEALPSDVARDFRAAAPDAVLDNLYGPTEAAVACTGYRIEPGEPWPDREDGPVALGGPFPDMLLGVRTEDGGVRPVGTPGGAGVGELCLAGRQVFDGYLDPADDRDRFVVDADRQWYRTGDRVADVGGREVLRHLGRADDQVKVRGYRIELGEVETALRAAAGGTSAAVVAVGNPAELVGFVEGVTDGDLPALRGALAARLPGYMVPQQILAVDRIPLNANGKADRQALRARARRPATPHSPEAVHSSVHRSCPGEI